MLISLETIAKSFGDKILYSDLALTLNDGEKVGLLGRNGTGKTTLFGIITGEDNDFSGEIKRKKGLLLAVSRQHHDGLDDKIVIDYISGDLPNFSRLKHIIDTYPETMGESMHKMSVYSDAIEQFSSLGYYDIESEIQRVFAAYQLDDGLMERPLGSLSGGQKRLVELVKVQLSKADLALIDEPTNHMDYVAKAQFLSWMKKTPEAVVVITHDRDVLQNVDRIVEIRDGNAYTFKGNYDDYLRVNTTRIVSELNEYETVQRRIINLKADVIRFKRLKEKARDPGTIARFKSLQHRAEAELIELQESEKPTVWIDKDSSEQLNDKISGAYEKHKARNIHIGTKEGSGPGRRLVRVDNLSLGYDEPLFSGISFDVVTGGRTRLHGRNGAGKTTLVSAILASAAGAKPAMKIYGGVIEVEKALKIGVYHQEIEPEILDLTLAQAVEQAYMSRDVPIGDQKVRQIIAEYLFNPMTDGLLKMSVLSGGQKARFQLIRMLAADPQILILDEPTNHLDLPSIEELEAALARYHGAIIYISHDSYFAGKIGGETIVVEKSKA